ncbi:MAG: YbjQ family protein [Ignavibacteriaceae bacterium]|nr:YbjQ family protein [Ignavibacteriaceae bacterium]
MSSRIQLITTTSSIEGWEIQKYFGLVSYQLVVGANIFRDVFASFRDVFGGSIKGYQRELEEMESIALENLKKKATKLGANVILGVRLDFDEVSGSGKSMFMLSASGTAAFGKPLREESFIMQNEKVSLERIEFEIDKESTIAGIKAGTFSIYGEDSFEAFLQYNIVATDVVINYLETLMVISEGTKNLLTKYFSSIPRKAVNDILVSDLLLRIKSETFDAILYTLRQIEWYDYDVFFTLLRSDNPKVTRRCLYLLAIEKFTYMKEDIENLKKLVQITESSYQKFPIMKKSKGVFGKEKDKWECIACGNLNDMENNYCNECRGNIYGILQDKITPKKIIDGMNDKIKILQKIFYD